MDNPGQSRYVPCRMADHYVKLWSSIVDSSVWKEPDRHRIVWITMLTMADRNGFVGASVDGLARRANVPEEDVEAALASFLAPDKRSRNQEHEGRRIQVVPRGWHIINHGYFRDLQDREELRAYERDRKREQRARDDLSRAVPDKSHDVHAPSSDADAASVAVSGKGESTREGVTRRHASSRPVTPCPEGVSEQVWQDFLVLRKQHKAPVTATALAGIAREAAKAGWPMEKALSECVARGWRGFKAEWVAEGAAKGSVFAGRRQTLASSHGAANAFEGETVSKITL